MRKNNTEVSRETTVSNDDGEFSSALPRGVVAPGPFLLLTAALVTGLVTSSLLLVIS